MNIGFVTLPLKAGGGERLVLEEIRFLRDNGYNVCLYPLQDDPHFRKEIDLSDIVVRELPTVRSRISSVDGIIRRVRWLRNRFLKDKIDLVISHYSDELVYLATIGQNIKYICHVNGSPFWFVNTRDLWYHSRKSGYLDYMSAISGHAEFPTPQVSLPNRLYLECREYLRSRSRRRANLVTTITNTVADELNFCYGIEPAIAYPGVSDQWLDFECDIEPEDLPNVETSHAILNIGRLDVRKRNDLLINAFSQYCNTENRRDVTLIIGGKGPQEQSLRQLAMDLNIDNQVLFPGYIPERDLPKYYAATDVFTHPAWVAYGLVPLEAYALGTRIAISTDAMVREIVEDEPGVSIIPPDAELWARQFGELIESTENECNRSVVPTWTEYNERKLEIYREANLV